MRKALQVAFICRVGRPQACSSPVLSVYFASLRLPGIHFILQAEFCFKNNQFDKKLFI